MDLHEINPLPIGLWAEEDINKVLEEILKDPLFDDIK